VGDLVQEIAVTLQDVEDLRQTGPGREPNICAHVPDDMERLFDRQGGEGLL